MALRIVQVHPLHSSAGKSGPEEAVDLPQLWKTSLTKQRPGVRARAQVCTPHVSLMQSSDVWISPSSASPRPGEVRPEWRRWKWGEMGLGLLTQACCCSPPFPMLLRNNIWGVRKTMDSNLPPLPPPHHDILSWLLNLFRKGG